VTSIYGRSSTSLAGTLTGTLGGMPFGPLSQTISDSVSGFGDLYPNFTLRWNAGVNNYMAYMMGDVPVGTYDSTRLSNLGIGHAAFDAGGGYTYFDPKTGHEFSGMLGFTANAINPSTQYQNGIDMHFDWGASQFLTKQLQVGLVGYAYKQLTCDSGSGDRVVSKLRQPAGPQLHVFSHPLHKLSHTTSGICAILPGLVNRKSRASDKDQVG
jgi:hypothetical protein